ncbi:MAG: GNAT family N-acetyltransferase [Trueperaceae bacterium]|nr:GNAT family N-acetyltransferase [Trueperaceae bacterium]
MNFSIRAVDIKAATQKEYELFSDFANRMRAERLPDDPARGVEELIQQAKNIPPIVELYSWVVEHPEDEGFIGSAETQIFRLEENQHVAQFSIEVLPDFRRQGIATTLLQKVTEVAEQEGRRLLVASTNERIPAGEAFMQKLGAEKALESHTNQLDLRELNSDLIEQWIDNARQQAQGFELLFWQGAYPEEKLESFAKLFAVMNTAPRGNLQVEDFHFSPEMLRQMEQMLFATGSKRWTMIVVEQTSGHFAGYTELTWNPNRPQILNQQGTGVYPEYRNLGLGRWLKAAMLDKVMTDLPEARFIRTGNADSNAPMLKINRALGFKPYSSQAEWQIDIAKVKSFLEYRQK